MTRSSRPAEGDQEERPQKTPPVCREGVGDTYGFTGKGSACVGGVQTNRTGKSKSNEEIQDHWSKNPR